MICSISFEFIDILFTNGVFLKLMSEGDCVGGDLGCENFLGYQFTRATFREIRRQTKIVVDNSKN